MRQGFPSSVLGALESHTQLTDIELAQLLGITTRMLAPRKRKGTLSCQESERLFRAARVIARAEEVFDEIGNAVAWPRSPIIVLRESTPFSLLDTEIGGDGHANPWPHSIRHPRMTQQEL